MTEIERIFDNITGQEPPPVKVKIRVDSDLPKETIERIISVILVVLEACSMKLPEDNWWRKRLPKWFVDSFGYSLEEIMNDPGLWDFASWIDASKYRGWEWWSSHVKDASFCIKLHVYEDPYVIGPFEYVIRASGGTGLKIS